MVSLWSERLRSDQRCSHHEYSNLLLLALVLSDDGQKSHSLLFNPSLVRCPQPACVQSTFHQLHVQLMLLRHRCQDCLTIVSWSAERDTLAMRLSTVIWEYEISSIRWRQSQQQTLRLDYAAQCFQSLRAFRSVTMSWLPSRSCWVALNCHWMPSVGLWESSLTCWM